MVRQAGQPVRQARVGAQWYLAVLLIWALVLECLVYAVSVGGGTLGRGYSIGAVLAGPVAAAVLWWAVADPVPRDRRVGVFLAGMGLLWLIAAAWSVRDGVPTSPSALLLPVLLLLAWGKPPSPEAALAAARALAWALVVVVAAAVLLESISAVPSWYVLEGVDRRGWIEADRVAYWLPLAELLGFDARWAGPFNHPNVAGMVGAYLLVLGAHQLRTARAVFCTVGALVLLATSSRTSMAAALAGLCVLLGTWWLRRPSRLSTGSRAMLAGLPVLLVLLLWVTANPALTGRTSIWPVYAALWSEAPGLGQGQVGIDVAVRSGRLPDWAHHGHNLLLDTAARYGVLGLVALGAVLVLALLIVVAAARRGTALGLALVVTVLVAGLTETTLRWLYLTVPVSMLVMAVLMSAGAAPPARVLLPAAPVRGSDPGQSQARTPAGDG